MENASHINLMFTYSLYKNEMVDICDISCVTKYAYVSCRKEIYRYDNCQGYICVSEMNTRKLSLKLNF